jgi:uncharacterized protein YkwD
MTLPLALSASHPHRRTPRVRALLLTVVVAAGMFAGLIGAASPAAATLPPRTTLENAISWAVKRLINTERAVHGLPPVYNSDALRLAARRHDVTMAKYDEMSHQLPGEAWFGRRFQLAGYNWSWAGENIGWNSAFSEAAALFLQRLMYNETPPNDGHRLNILNTHYRNVGVDVYFDKVHHKLWLTTDFGHRP